MPAPHITPEQLLQHQDWLFRLVRRLVKDDFTADDMVQATMVEALVDDQAGASNLPGWLSSTARRLVAQSWRSDYRRQEREQKVALDDNAILHQSAEVTELFNVANSALGDLPEQERVVIMLRHMQGWKSERVAAELQIPVQRVYRDAERGCKKLKDRLQDKYGREWKASCIAILGIPIGRAAASTAGTALGIAASIAVVAAGLWASGLFQSAPTLAIDSVAAAAVSNPIFSEQDHSAAGNASGGIDRSEISTPPHSEAGYSIQILGPAGNPIENASVSVSYRDGTAYWGSASKDLNTDETGLASFLLPQGSTPAGVMVLAEGLLFRHEVQPNITLGGTHVIHLFEGHIEAQFQLEVPRSGVHLQVTSESGFTGLCTTDSHGFASLLLPSAEKYEVRHLPILNYSKPINFDLPESGNSTPYQIPYSNPQAYSLLATDLQGGTVLHNAQFFLHRPVFDEDGRPAGSEESPLESSQGLLNYVVDSDRSNRSVIRIESPGYEDAFVNYVKDDSQVWKIAMHPLQSVTANLRLAPRRSIVSAEKHAGVSSIDFLGYTLPKISWRDVAPVALQVLSPSTVLFPRNADGIGSECKITILDDLGQYWSSQTLKTADYMGAELEIPLTLLIQDTTQFHFVGTPAADRENVYSLLATPLPLEYQGSTISPDANGMVTVNTTVGNQWNLNFESSGYTFSFYKSAGSEIENATYTVVQPPRTSTLKGRVVDANGVPYPDTMISAVPSTKLEISGPGDLINHGAYFHIPVKDGVVLAENMFSGSYDLTISHAGITFTMTVTADEDFVMQAPRYVEFLLQVRDSVHHQPLAAQLMRLRENPRLSPSRIAESDSIMGHLSVKLVASEVPNLLFIQAEGFQPVLLSDFMGGLLQVVDLKAGREVSFSYRTLEIRRDPDAHWTVDAWGEDHDPRHRTISRSQINLSASGLPLEEFQFIERDSQGEPTGRTVDVHSDGSFEVHLS